MPPRPQNRRTTQAAPKPAPAPTAPPAAPVAQAAAPRPAADPGTARVIIQPATARVAVPAGGASVTTVSNGAVLEGQLDGLIRTTSVDELVREGKANNLKTVKESQLRELIRQAISQVITAAGGAGMDEATLDRVQAELKRSLAERQREARERSLLEDRVRQLEAEAARHRQLAEDHDSDLRDAEHQAQVAEDELVRLHAEIDELRQRLASVPAAPAQDPQAERLVALLMEVDRDAWNGGHLRAARIEDPSRAELIAALRLVPALREHLLHLRADLARLAPEVAGDGAAVDLARVQRAAEDHRRDQTWINELQTRVAAADRQLRADAAALAHERERTADLDARLSEAADTIVRLEAELAARTADATRKPLPPGPAAGAFIAAAGRPRAAWTATTGRLHLATHEGVWRTHDLPAAARGPVVGWHREADASDRLLVVGADGRPLEVVRGAAGRAQLVAIAAPASADDGLTAAVVPADDAVHAALRDGEGRIHLLRSNRGSWRVEELTGPLQAPRAAGAPACWWWARENSLHVAYPGADGRLHELFELSGRWYHALLAEQAGAPPCAGLIAAHAPGAAEHVWFAAADGRLHLLSYDGAWRHRAVAAECGAPIAAGAPAVVERDNGAQIALYRGGDGRLHAIEQHDGTWRHRDLAAACGAAPAAQDPAAVLDGALVRATYTGIDGRLHQLTLDGAWRHAVIGN